VGHSANSCTGAVEAATPFELDGRQVVLLDTPAFDHTDKSEAEILRNIALELETRYVPIPVPNERSQDIYLLLEDIAKVSSYMASFICTGSAMFAFLTLRNMTF